MRRGCAPCNECWSKSPHCGRPAAPDSGGAKRKHQPTSRLAQGVNNTSCRARQTAACRRPTSATKKTRKQRAPRCLHCRLGPSVRGRGEALVHLYAGATTGVFGVLHGVQGCVNLARACRWRNNSELVVSMHVEPRAGRAGSAFDVGLPMEVLCRKRHHGTVKVV